MTNLEFVGICEVCKRELPISSLDNDLEICNDCSFSSMLNSMEELQVAQKYKFILSIDVGIKHLGMSLTRVCPEYTNPEVVWFNLFDITTFDCLPGCKLYHEKTPVDWIAHITHKYSEIFLNATHILIERQPPNGQTNIEQLLFAIMREKSTLIHPRSVHTYFNMGSCDYETRKVISERIASKYVCLDNLKKYDRMHDITDSILFMLYWCSVKRKELETIRLEEKRAKSLRRIRKGFEMSIEDYFNIYRYVPTQTKK